MIALNCWRLDNAGANAQFSQGIARKKYDGALKINGAVDRWKTYHSRKESNKQKMERPRPFFVSYERRSFISCLPLGTKFRQKIKPCIVDEPIRPTCANQNTS